MIGASNPDMMLSAAILAAAIFANAFAHERADTTQKLTPASTLTLPIVVEVASGMKPTHVARTLAEAGDIWRLLGVTLEWQLAGRGGSPGPAGRETDCSLRVTIGDVVSAQPAGRTALGWIVFRTPDAPEPVIHLSRAGAVNLMHITPRTRDVPLVLQDRWVARALGRALAHEVGHYLLGPAHTPRGLMQGTRPAGDFFTIERTGFDLTPEQLDTLARHVTMTPPE